MAIDLLTSVDTSLPQIKQSQNDEYDDLTVTLPPSRDHHNHYEPHVVIPHEFGSNMRRRGVEQGILINKDDDEFVAELTRHMMAHFILQQPHHKFNFFRNNSRNSEQMRIEEISSEHGYGNHQSMKNSSNVGNCTRQSLIQEQIRAIQLSRLKQEQIMALKQKLASYRELQFQNRCRNNRIRQPPCSEMQANFMGGSDSRAASCGTGVFLPRARINASSNSSKTPGKGCSNILIPARVVQALQLHFDHMAATSGPNPAGFPPLHDVLVSNRDGMYSLQKRQSRKPPANMQIDMILPQEWTY